jgi:hypothetical protein
MEIIIVLAIVGVIIAYLVIQRRKELPGESQPVNDWPAEPAAPYKVETTPTPAEAVVEVAPVVATAEVAAPAVVDEVVTDKPAPKAKKTRKPKAVVADDSAVAAVKKPRKPRSKKV